MSKSRIHYRLSFRTAEGETIPGPVMQAPEEAVEAAGIELWLAPETACGPYYKKGDSPRTGRHDMTSEQESRYAKAMEEFDRDPVEENFWADRTDSENELERLRAAREQAWDAGYALGVHDEQTSQETTGGQIRPARVNPYRR